MDGILLIRDLAVVLVVAGGAAWLCQRLGLSAVVGYLTAGALIGPYTPPFALVNDLDRIQTLAQIGLVFLIFSIGLNLSLNRLKRLGPSTAVATVITAFLVLSGTRLVGWITGWSPTASLFFAAMLMVSSSAIISKVLDELNLTHERPGQMALAMTVFEDVVAITMLTLLSSLTRFGEGGAQSAGSLLPTLGALGAFIVLLALLSLLVVPRLLTRLSQDAEPEIRTLVVGGILLALAWLAVELGYSLALGAFVFGVIVGSTRYRADIERTFDGLRQLFGAVFFVAVGMMVDFVLLSDSWPMMLGLTALALFLRPVAAAIGFLGVGNPPRESVQAALAVTPLGEFTFVIAQLGVESGALPKSAYPVAAGASLLTALASPLLTRHGEALSTRMTRAQLPFLAKPFGMYRSWLQRWKHRPTAGILWRLSKTRLLQIGMHLILVSALLIMVRPIYEGLRSRLGAETPHTAQQEPGPQEAAAQMPSTAATAESTDSKVHEGLVKEVLPVAFWTAFGLVLLGPLISIWRNVSALSMILADAATFGNPRQALLRPMIERVLSMLALVLLGAWLMLVLPSGWSLLGPAGMVLLLLVLVATVFWRRFIKLQTRIEVQLVDQLHRASQVTSASAWSDTLPRHTDDWDLEIEEVTLPADTIYAGTTLRQLGLRPKFGCSVIGIDRQGHSIVNPSADTVLFPLDKLLLLGGHESLINAARELLRFGDGAASQDGFEDLTMETVTIPENCSLAGQSLRDLNLIRKYGIQVGGIRRGQKQILSPSGEDRLKAGDELLLLGTHSQIKDFSEWVANCGG